MRALGLVRVRVTVRVRGRNRARARARVKVKVRVRVGVGVGVGARARARARVSLLSAGLACQSFSRAGEQRGLSDSRGDLFFEIVRIARARRPRALLLENVPNLLRVDNGRAVVAVAVAVAAVAAAAVAAAAAAAAAAVAAVAAVWTQPALALSLFAWPHPIQAWPLPIQARAADYRH